MVSLMELAARLIVVFEGRRLNAYQDSGGVWTIGIGHTRTAKPGMVINDDEVVTLFTSDVKGLLALVEKFPPVKAAALLSFGFNCGAGALRRVLSGEIKVSLEGFAVGDRKFGERDIKGNLLQGLVARRRLEAALIMMDGGM